MKQTSRYSPFRIGFVGAALVVLGLLLPSLSFAQSLTLQGKLTTSAGAAIEGSAVQFRVQILSPVEQCVLYDETQIKNLTSSGGLFTVSLNDGTGTRNDGNSWTFKDALANHGSFGVAAANCQTGSGTVTFTPTSNSERKVLITFKDPSFMASFDSMPVSTLTHSAYASDSSTLSGAPLSSVCRVEDVSGNPQTATAMTPANYTELLAIINGTTSQYAKSNGSGFTPTSAVSFNSQRLTNLATPTTGTDATNKTYTDSYVGGKAVDTATMTALAAGDAGKVLSWNGTQWTVATGTTQWGSYGTSIYYSTGNVGIGTTSPTNNLGFGGEAARTIGVERTTTGTTGNSLTIKAGDALSGGTNLSGGDLFLNSGISTGNGAGSIFFQTSGGGGSGATDKAVGTRMVIDGSGLVGVGGNGVNANGKLYSYFGRSNPTTTSSAIYGLGDISQSSGNTSGESYGVWGRQYPTVTAVAAQTSGYNAGVLAQGLINQVGAIGTVNYLIGLRADYGVSSAATSATLVNGYGVYVKPIHGAGTFSNSYGVYVETPNGAGSVTNEYGFYQASATAKNYFGGTVGIGVASPQATLDINGYARLKPLSAQPAACAAANDGALAMTSQYRLCACKSSTTAWVNTADGSACSW